MGAGCGQLKAVGGALRRGGEEVVEELEVRGWELCGPDSLASCRDPSTARPDAPENGAKKKSGRSGRDDSVGKVTRESGRSGPSRCGQVG